MRKKEKEKAKFGMASNLGYMLSLARRVCPSVLILGVLWALLSAGILVLQFLTAPLILQKIETHAALPVLLETIGGLALSLILANGVLGYLEENVLFGRITLRTRIILDVNRKACMTSFPNTRDPAFLKIHQRAMSECGGNNMSTEHIWTTLTTLLMNLLCFSIYLGFVLRLGAGLILIVVGTSAAEFFISNYVYAWEERHREEDAAIDKEFYYLKEKASLRTLAKDIRIFGLETWLNELLNKVMKTHDAFVCRRERFYFWANAADALFSFARNGIAYAFLIHAALRGELTASEFLLYFSAFSGFSLWIAGILKEATKLHQESLGISIVRECLTWPECFRMEGGRPLPRAAEYELTMDRVSFCYPGSERKIIDGMSLTIKPGERLAVVGLNGAGKTTLVKLLCGFYDPDEGRVLLNGIDLREFNRREYYELFSAVFQDFSELDVTVAEAVAQRPSEIDRSRVESCLDQAGLREKIAKMPLGLDTHLGKKVYEDGVLLSGGEMQRLMMARALYKGGEFLFLDEPTAALDPLAEHDIYVKYNEMMRGKSSVFISHRLASTRFCDRILFLKDGKIAESGTHETLLARGGEYAQLFEIQARYYQEGGETHESAV